MRRAVLSAALAVLAAACSSSPKAAPRPQSSVPAGRDLSPYEGLGTWVDAYDYAPAFQQGGGPPPVTPDSVADMAALGVRTLYLQAAKDDPRSPGDLIDRRLVGRFLARAHEAGLRVVAWYLPKLADPDRDLARLRFLDRYEARGQRFDGLAVDVEWIEDVPDAAERNRRLVSLSRRLDAAVGDDPIGAIVLPPVALEVVNPDLWPAFPWRSLAPSYDVWLTMGYWTFREPESGYRDAYRYTDENLRRLRADLGDGNAVVHPIGGIGDISTRADYEGFVRAAREHRAVGWSVYDFQTTSSAAWPRLRP